MGKYVEAFNAERFVDTFNGLMTFMLGDVLFEYLHLGHCIEGVNHT